MTLKVGERGATFERPNRFDEAPGFGHTQIRSGTVVTNYGGSCFQLSYLSRVAVVHN